jgi:tRNA(adenine34) deaminase
VSDALCRALSNGVSGSPSRVVLSLSKDEPFPFAKSIGRPSMDNVSARMALVDLEALMDAALAEARRAREAGEVPIGAVVAVSGEIVGRGFNQPIGAADPTAHAEIVAIREAARRAGNYRLSGATLCVTIEPCLMCVGALVHARIGTLVYGAAEPKSGAVRSAVRGDEIPGQNHRFLVVSGVREDECRELMQTFFKERRFGD